MNAGGPTIAEYVETRHTCLATLIDKVAELHHTSRQEVRAAVGAHRHVSLDLLVIASFAVFYTLFASRFTRAIWRRFPPASDRTWGIAATLAISPIASFLGTVLGGFWSWYTETLRIGYGHLVERVDRIPWNHHLTAIFISGVVIFWLLSWIQYRKSPAEARAASTSLGLGLI